MTAACRADTVGAEVNADVQHEDSHLVDDAQRGNRGARDRLVTAYLPAVRSIALHYRAFGMPVEDLVQEGSLGLLEAIDHFDARRGADFEGYARFRIRRAIRNSLTEQSRLIRLPKQIVDRKRILDRAESGLRCATGRTPTTDELAAATGLSLDAVLGARAVGIPPLSLDQPMLADGATREALVADATAPDPAAETVGHEQVRAVDEAVAALSPREREIVSRHFGFGCEPEQIAEVAETLHVSQQRVRAIERHALYALRDRLEQTDVTPHPSR